MSMTRPPDDRHNAIRALLERAAAEAGVSVAAMLSYQRRGGHMTPFRDRAMADAADMGASLPEIGYVFQRDHTSVMTAIRRARS